MSMPEEKNIQTTRNKGQGWRAVLWKRIRQIFFYSFLLLTLTYLIFQIPPIQNWIVKKIAASLSERLETEVKIDRFFLLFIDKLELENLYVEDPFEKDTLIASRKLIVDINSNIFTLIRKGIIVQDVQVRNAQFNLRKGPGAEQNNLQLVLSKLIKPDTTENKKSSSGFQLDLEHIYLEDVLFTKNDQVRGQRFHLYVGRGEIEINELNLKERRVEISELYLSDPVVEVDEYPEVLPDNWVEEEDTAVDTSHFYISIDQFSMLNGVFNFNNYRRSPVRIIPEDQVDYDHLNVEGIDILVEQFDFDVIQHDYEGIIKNMAFREKSGFVVRSIKAKEAIVNAKEMVLNEFEMITPFSTLGDTLTFRYDTYYDYTSFVDSVKLDGRINNADVAVKDIMVFAPALNENVFFRNNRETILNLNGKVKGTINNLSGRDLNIQLADGTLIKGRFSSDSLAVRQQEVLKLKLDQLSTSVRTLRQLIPGFDLPSNFDNMGKLDFKGRFTGFFADFVAEGKLQTDIGNAVMNMHMDLKEGRNRASYEGNLSLEEFDLGKWSNNPDLGTINVSSSVNNGVGLTLESVKANLNAQIQNFSYKGYTYENAEIKGDLAKNLFKGNLDFKDDNVDFKFRGEVDVQDTVPIFDFYVSVNRLALKKVNLSPRDLVLSGDLELQLKTQKDIGIVGEGNLIDLFITEDNENQYRLNNLFALLDAGPAGNKLFVLQSDIVDANLTGEFDLLEIPKALLAQFQTTFPGIAYHTGFRDSLVIKNEHECQFDFQIKDTKGFNRLIDSKLENLSNIESSGYFGNQTDSVLLKLNIPYLEYDSTSFSDIAITLDLEQQEGILETIVGQIDQKGEQLLPRTSFLGDMLGDTVNFAIDYEGLEKEGVDSVSIDGVFSVLDSTYMQVLFNQFDFNFLKKNWSIQKDNSIQFSRDSIFVENFEIHHKKELVTMTSFNGKSVTFQLDGFNLDLIDQLWEFEPFDFSGSFRAEASIQDIFKQTGLHATVLADTLGINGDDWGGVRIDLDAESLKSPLFANANIIKGPSQILIDGFYNLPAIPTANSRKIPDNKKANYFAFDAEIYNFPIDFSKYFIGSNVSNIKGNCEADIELSGFPEKPNITGFLKAKEGAFTIDYLNTRYNFKESFITIGNQMFNASGTELFDVNGNSAVLFGGITHNHLKNFGLDARLKTENFLAMNVPKSRNELYYGKAFGAGNILFSGDFERTDIYVDATVTAGTELYIPIRSATNENSNIDFINFVNKHEPKEETKTAVNKATDNRIRGLSLEMNLNVTEKAKVEIIFNEQAGDKISGKGRGNLQILIPRGGAMQMFGNYIIEEGDYLFTLYNIASKKFTVKRGGTITWSGDPFSALINIEAQYGDIRTSIANFIPEYLVTANDALTSEASQPTKVDLSLKLQGELLRPVINFDIQFPDVKGRLGTFLDSKMRTLKQDLNSLNRQVFGLIIVGQFLPPDFGFAGTDVIYNTLSEFLSNQLSVLLTDLFSEVIDGESALSGIDFDIAYYQSQNINYRDGQDISAGEEFQIGQRLNFYDDRLVVYIGGNLEIGNTVQATQGSGTFLGNDLVIEYSINDDRTLKLRFYQRLQPDVGGGRKLQVGTGLSFRKEFDSFKEFWQSFKKDSKDSN